VSIDLIIFDCDGVLVDSELLTHQVLTGLVADLGGSAELLVELESFKSKALTETFPFIEQRLGRKLPTDFEAQYREQTFTAFQAHLQPIAGVHQVLPQLRIPFCVASNGPVSKIRFNLELTGLWSYFAGKVFSCYDIQRWKPEPDIYLYAARQMGAAPARCGVIEDSVVGTQAGRSAGMTVLGYAGQSDGTALRAAGAQVFYDMHRLPDVLALLPTA